MASADGKTAMIAGLPLLATTAIPLKPETAYESTDTEDLEDFLA
jgi:hypothetical protein